MILVHLSACLDVDSITPFKKDCISLINSIFSPSVDTLAADDALDVGSSKYNGMKPRMEINTRNWICFINFGKMWDKHCMYSTVDDGGSSFCVVDEVDRMEFNMALVRSMDVNG